MFTIELLNGTHGCSANCATCPTAIKTLPGSRDTMNTFITRLVALYEKYRASYVFSSTGNIDQLIPLVETHGVTHPSDFLTILNVPTTPMSVVRETLQFVSEKFPKTELAIGIVDKGVTISAANTDALFSIIDMFAQSSLPYLLLNFPNNYCDPAVFAASESEFLYSDRKLFAQIRERYTPSGKRQEAVKLSYDEHVDVYHARSKFDIRPRKVLYVARRILSPHERVGYNWALFRESARAVLLELRSQMKELGGINEGFLSMAPFGVRVSHQSFDPANPFLWFSYDEMNQMLDQAECGSLDCVTEFFELIAERIRIGLALLLENEGIASTDLASIEKISQLRTAFIEHIKK